MIFNIIFIAAGIAAAVFLFYLRYLIIFFRIPRKIDAARKLMATDEKKAVELLNGILSIDRGNPEANWIIAHYHLKKKWYVLALMYLHDIIRYGRYTMQITELDVRELLADTYERSGNPDKAVQQFAEIKKKHPLTAAQFKKIIRLLNEMGEPDNARNTINEASTVYQMDGEFCFLAAQIEYAQREYGSAENSIRSAEEKGYSSADTDLLMGKICFILQNYEEAIQRFQKLPHDYLMSEEIEGLLGQAFYRIKDYSKAEDTLSQIVHNMDPGDPHRSEAMFFLGCAREMKGAFNSAIDIWKQIPSFPKDLSDAAREKITFYTEIAASDAERTFISEGFSGFALASETLMNQMDYIVKRKVFQDEKTNELMCTFRKDSYLFNLYYFCFTRQTAPVSEFFLKEKNFRRIAEKAKYLTVIAPWFTEKGKTYAQENDIAIFTLEIFRKNGLMK
jgi:tetratricopeptide (TPR) repeat protein